jgi:putative SOS response-associated peptidase YedK
MCGRYSLKTTNPQEFIDQFGPFDGLESPRYNRAPGQAHPAIINREKQHLWTSMIWGNFSRKADPSNSFFPINARSETVTRKNIFKDAISMGRCLIPADGWFEWQLIEKQKYPYYHHLEDHTPFAFAGIWTSIKHEAEKQSVFSILTRPASPECLHIHHRAPLILPVEVWESWLSPDLAEKDILQLLMVEQPLISAYQVGSRVNSTRYDDAGLLEPNQGKQSLLF